MATDSADYYMLVNDWVWSKSRDCLLRPEVDMGVSMQSGWEVPSNTSLHGDSSVF